MSEWDTAHHQAASDRKSHSGSLRTPLLPDEPSSSSGSRQGGNITKANQSRVDAHFLSSVTSDEISHGEGKGLKLMYAAHTEEEWETQLAEERERDIISTAQNVQQVNEIFQEVAQLVASQQEDVDAIESQVGSAVDRTKAGVKQLENANRTQKGISSCYFYILMFLLFLMIVLAMFIFWDDITGSADDDGQ
mmetsp:Transcript_75670/g.152049  ORF Transcript_75670/g.152049 Transcript_75670/m.152049 type:complete len:192 (-) Transcript_75670:193-768(-)